MILAPLLWRASFLLLTAALAACSSAPEPRTRPPTTLAEINRALSWRFADVELASDVVIRGLRGVEVTPERLLWTNESGQRREMPIDEVARIVLRGRDPDATPPTEGARMLADTPPFPLEPDVGPPVSGSFEGGSAVLVGALYGALYLASEASEDPGVVIYEAPVTRYLAAEPAVEAPPGPAPAAEEAAPPPL